MKFRVWLLLAILLIPLIQVSSQSAYLEPAQIDLSAYEDRDFITFNISAWASENLTANLTGLPNKVYPLGCADNGTITLNLTTSKQNITMEVNVSAFSVGTHEITMKLEANGSTLDTSILKLREQIAKKARELIENLQEGGEYSMLSFSFPIKEEAFGWFSSTPENQEDGWRRRRNESS